MVKKTTCTKSVKNCKILTLKVNFLCQKLSKSFKKNFHSTFFEKFNFWSTSFSKMMSDFLTPSVQVCAGPNCFTWDSPVKCEIVCDKSWVILDYFGYFAAISVPMSAYRLSILTKECQHVEGTIMMGFFAMGSLLWSFFFGKCFDYLY